MREGDEHKLEFERVLEVEEIMWRQKSRVQCLKEGDNNTNFFSIRWLIARGVSTSFGY